MQIDSESVCFAVSKQSLHARKEMVRPLSRKDIFYSGSVINLPEYQTQKSLTSYRQSVVSLPRYGTQRAMDGGDVEKGPRKYSSQCQHLFPSNTINSKEAKNHDQRL